MGESENFGMEISSPNSSYINTGYITTNKLMFQPAIDYKINLGLDTVAS